MFSAIHTLLYEIKTEDAYADCMKKQMIKTIDISDYPENNEYHSNVKK